MHKNRFYLLGHRSVPMSARESSTASQYVTCSSPNAKPIKFISLFSGAMGLDLGLEAAGFQVAGCLELDKKACATIIKNRPEIPLICDDLRNWTGDKLLSAFKLQREDIAFIAGGPPCPSFSTAGKRQSFNDPRGQVMFDYLRIIAELRPPFFVMENVRGILSASLTHVPIAKRRGQKDTGRGTVLKLLADTFCEMGYTVSVELVNAANYGTPQKRERVIFLGSRDGFRSPCRPRNTRKRKTCFAPSGVRSGCRAA